IAAFHFVPILLDAIAWHVLFPKAVRPRWQSLFWMRWIGESISNLIPSAAVGGDIVRARLTTIAGTPMAAAAASVIVDVTLGVVTQIVFTLLGLVLLVEATGRTSLVGPTLVGAIVAIVAIAGFYIAQRLGMFRFVSVIITRLVKSPEWSSLVQSGETLDQTVRDFYARRRQSSRHSGRNRLCHIFAGTFPRFNSRHSRSRSLAINRRSPFFARGIDRKRAMKFQFTDGTTQRLKTPVYFCGSGKIGPHIP